MARQRLGVVIAALFIGAVSLILAGCKQDSSSGKDNFSDLCYYGEPQVQVSRDPQADFAKYRTCVLVPVGEGVPAVAAKQITHLVRTNLELQGFGVEDSLEKADLVLALYADTEQRETVLPAVTIPWPLFRSTLRSEKWSGTVGNTPWTAKGSEWGSTSTQTIPVTIPERRRLRWWHHLSVIALDGTALRSVLSSDKGDAPDLQQTVVWQGMAFGSMDVADPVRGVQGLFRRLASRFPIPSNPAGETLGLVLFVATLDGETFYPAVFGVARGGPADRAGVREYDLITGVDGTPTANLSGAQLRSLLETQHHKKRELTIKRLDRVLTVKMQA
jgi:hypothetical protein